MYFSRLRTAIAGANGDRQPIVTSRNGYALEIDADELDLERFRRLAARGRAAAAAREWDVAWTTLGEALNMWRQTTALACLTTSPLTDARRELEDERLWRSRTGSTQRSSSVSTETCSPRFAP